MGAIMVEFGRGGLKGRDRELKFLEKKEREKKIKEVREGREINREEIRRESQKECEGNKDRG